MSGVEVNQLLLRTNPDGTYSLDTTSIAIDAWQAIPLSAQWQAPDPLLPAQYYRDPFGIVRLRGWVTPVFGPTNAAIGTLPAGARWGGAPGSAGVFPCSAGFVSVNAGGLIVPGQVSSGYALDPISFRAV